jgi:hypothetical protein
MMFEIILMYMLGVPLCVILGYALLSVIFAGLRVVGCFIWAFIYRFRKFFATLLILGVLALVAYFFYYSYG